MQPKVSMVMTCYNKVDYIGEMFNSVLAQKWDNIELILVNDGSDDGTREIITYYEQRFRDRGYDTVIIDQENAGVCAAAKAGFERITGDLLCSVDSDDELDPLYVSTLARWLEEHPEYDIAACEGINYTGFGERKQFQPFKPVEIIDGDPYLTERWLLCEFRAEPWRYMVRTGYFRKCRIIETYYTKTRGSHEPSYIIPLLSYGCKIMYFPLPLYFFNVNDTGHSRHKHVWQIKEHLNEYVRLCKIAIEALPDEVADTERKRALINTAIISNSHWTYYQLNELAVGKVHLPSNGGVLSLYAGHSTYLAFSELLDAVNTLFSINPPIKHDRAAGMEWLFFEMVKNSLVAPAYRIVGCGTSGRKAARLLPMLKGSPIEPTELWDETSEGMATTPDYASLSKNDIAIVFPKSEGEVAREICKELKKSGCAIIMADGVEALLNQYLTFPELMKIGRPNKR